MVALTFLNANKASHAGSGVLVSKDIILTAAHNIFDKKKMTEHTDFKVYIGACGTAEEYH